MPFHVIPGAHVVLRRKGGLYSQHDMYWFTHDRGLYAKVSGGYVRLKNTGTSRPDDQLVEMSLPYEYTNKKLDGLVLVEPLQLPAPE